MSISKGEGNCGEFDPNTWASKPQGSTQFAWFRWEGSTKIFPGANLEKKDKKVDIRLKSRSNSKVMGILTQVTKTKRTKLTQGRILEYRWAHYQGKIPVSQCLRSFRVPSRRRCECSVGQRGGIPSLKLT